MAGTQETALAEALAMTGLKTTAELIDMANVGQSLMERIVDLTKQEGPFNGWMPADDPAEIVFDLVNHYDDAALSRALEAGREAVRLPEVFEHAHSENDRLRAKIVDGYWTPTREDYLDAVSTFGAFTNAVRMDLAALPPVGGEGGAEKISSEQLARIIDPEAFKTYREVAAANGLDVDKAPPNVIFPEGVDALIGNREPSRRAALAKAAAIRAALAIGENA